MNPALLEHYKAIERASDDMLTAARASNWDEVIRLEGVCITLISELKSVAQAHHNLSTDPEADTAARAAREAKLAIMQRILANDAEIRALAEPWLASLDQATARPRLH